MCVLQVRSATAQQDTRRYLASCGAIGAHWDALDTVSADDARLQARGLDKNSLACGVDVNGNYAAENYEFTCGKQKPGCPTTQARTSDPLCASPALQAARAEYITTHKFADASTSRTGIWGNMAADVQRFVQYKEVCRELVECALYFRSQQTKSGFAWRSFGCSTPPAEHSYSCQVQMRSALAEIGLKLECN